LRRAVLITVGVIVLLIGVVWASQGAGVAGGSSFMDNNPTFIDLGGLVAVIGMMLFALGVLWRTKKKTSPPGPS
jgi:hypothetical protein